MSKVYLNTIYRATEGEGIHLGTPQIFVRLQGCHIGCVNCDSKETWAFPSSSLSSIEQVIDKVLDLSNMSKPSLKRVSITGGEPLHPRNREGLEKLITLLKKDLGFYVNLETSGLIFDEEIFSLVDFVSLDYKPQSTKISPSLRSMNPCDFIQKSLSVSQALQVKSVISQDEDFFEVLALKKELLDKDFSFPWCLTPAFNNAEHFPVARFQRIMHLNELHGGLFRFIGQQHKWIFGPDIKDV